MNIPVDPLTACLQGLLPSARLRETELQLRVPLRLLLIDPEGWDVPLSGEETDAIFEAPPYWSFCWGSGRALAARLLARPELVEDKTVLDFGSGSGVVAIAAALAGARRVTACDCDPVARQAIQINAERNGCAIETVAMLDDLDETPDLLLAADVLYDRDNLPLLQPFRRRAASVLLADSRIGDLRAPGYTLIGEDEAVTIPDLGESETVKRVRFYRATGGEYVQSDH